MERCDSIAKVRQVPDWCLTGQPVLARVVSTKSHGFGPGTESGVKRKEKPIASIRSFDPWIG